MPKKSSQKSARSKSARVMDLPVKSLKASQARSVTGGGRNKATTTSTPTESVSFSFGKIST